MLHDRQSFLNSKDDRGASCQVRSPKEDKETFDESSFIVATYNFNEYDNKEKQKSCPNFIGSTGRLPKEGRFPSNMKCYQQYFTTRNKCYRDENNSKFTNVYAEDTTQLERQFRSSSDYPSLTIYEAIRETKFSLNSNENVPEPNQQNLSLVSQNGYDFTAAILFTLIFC